MGDLFDIENTLSFNTDKLVEGNEYDYVTRTSLNQGILKSTGFVNQEVAVTQLQIGDVTVQNITSTNCRLGFYTSTIGKKVTSKTTIPKIEGAEGKPLTIRHYLNSGKTIGDSFTVKDLQVEIGDTATEYEEYKEPITYETTEDIKSVYPTTTLLVEDGVTIEAEYNKDINKVIENLTQAIISMGGNV